MRTIIYVISAIVILNRMTYISTILTILFYFSKHIQDYRIVIISLLLSFLMYLLEDAMFDRLVRDGTMQKIRDHIDKLERENHDDS
jgi:hypothetical protein